MALIPWMLLEMSWCWRMESNTDIVQLKFCYENTIVRGLEIACWCTICGKYFHVWVLCTWHTRALSAMRWPSWPFGKGFSHITTHTHNFITASNMPLSTHTTNAKRGLAVRSHANNYHQSNKKTSPSTILNLSSYVLIVDNTCDTNIIIVNRQTRRVDFYERFLQERSRMKSIDLSE